MEKYEVINQIGKGNFGSISKIRRISDGKILVWKELDYGRLDEKEKHHIVSEVNIIRELRHPNIVKYYDRIIDKKNTKIYIVMEYCEGGDIGQLIKRCRKTKDYIAEDVIWKVFTQVVLALNSCHNRKEGKVLHRDIKPSNVFLDADNNVKLGDFGLSRVLSNESNFAYSNVGTPYYMSPEQIDELRYNEKSDIWSLGCFLYEFASLRPPFEATNHLSLALKIKSGKIERINNRYSDELNRVIMWMMNVTQDSRPTSDDLLNLPQISLRLREKRLKESYGKLKKIEDNLKEKEKRLDEREKEQNLREKYLNEREDIINKKEALLIPLQMDKRAEIHQIVNEHNNINNNNEEEEIKDIYHKPIALNLSLHNYLNNQLKTTRKSTTQFATIGINPIDSNILTSYESLLTSRPFDPSSIISMHKDQLYNNTHSNNNEYRNRITTNGNTYRNSEDCREGSHISSLSNNSKTENIKKMTIDYSHQQQLSNPFQFDPSLYNNDKENNMNIVITNGNPEHIKTKVNINHTNVNMNIFNPSPRNIQNQKNTLYKKHLTQGKVSTPNHAHGNYSPLKKDKDQTRMTTIPRNNSYNFTHTTVSTNNNQVNTSYKKSYRTRA